jgi:S1-C subfamily serine protease
LTLLLSLGAAVAAQDPARTHVEFYKKVAPGVVAVRQSDVGPVGSGVIVDPRGFVLASSLTIQGERSATVFFADGRSESATVVARVPRLELAVLKIAGARTDYPALPLGSSADVRPGRICYVLGDSFGSIVADGQPAISVGVVSGRYELAARQNHTYAGPVLETSAACNPNQAGAPLLDAQGRLLGLVTMNYHEARFAGVAVPVDALREAVARAIEGRPLEAPAAERGWIGVDFELVQDQVVVRRVFKEGPAREADLRRGDLVLALTHQGRGGAVRTLKELEERLAGVAPGDPVTLRIHRESENAERQVTITAVRQEYY